MAYAICSSGEYTKNNPNVIRYDYFETDINYHDGEYVVAFDVEVYKNSNNYRTHKIIDLTVSDVEMASATASSGLVAPLATALTDESSLYTDNVTQSKKKGNTNRDKAGNPSDWTATKASGNKAENAKSLSEIIADIQHDFGINITTGHIKDKQSAGTFNTRDNGIRTKITNDLPTVSHELGHWFDNQYKLTDNLSNEVKKELKAALGDLAAQYKPSVQAEEGLAEFFRKYLQNNETAAIDYPETTKLVLSKLSPKDLAKLTALAEQINAYYSMGADTAESAIVYHENRIIDKRTILEKFSDAREKQIQMWIDNRHGIRRMGQSVGSNMSYIYATNAAYADARATEIILGDITDLDGYCRAPGLKKALYGINTDAKSKEYRNFGEYLVMRHGLEYLREGKRVFADDRMNSSNYMENRIAELNKQYPQFESAAQRLYVFLDQFMKAYAIDSGLLTPDSYSNMKKMYPEYVPFFRAGYKTKGNSLARAKGSGRAIVHPVDNIINMVTKMVSNATNNNVMLKIRDEALSLGVDAKFIEKIPDVQVPKEFDARGLKKELTDKSMDELISLEASKDVTDAMLDILEGINDTLVQFETAKANDTLRKNIVVMLVNGKKEYWKVNDPLLFESITSMNAHTSNAVLNAYAKATRFMTSNITGRNVIWSLFSNAPRDLQTAYTYMGNANPLPLIKGIGSTWLNSFKESMDKGSVSPLYKEYLSMGGGDAGVWQGQETFVKDVRKMLKDNYHRLNFNPLTWVSFVGETIEMGPRFAMYSYCRKVKHMSMPELLIRMQATTATQIRQNRLHQPRSILRSLRRK